MTITDLLELGQRRLQAFSGARFEAELLLGFALEVNRSFLYANPGFAVPERRRANYLELLRRRRSGEPVAYLLARRSFWSLELRVTPAVLIPRPETELVVETVLKLLPAGEPCRVADLGTGSGAIALALARERPQWHLFATDVSAEALDVARGNATEHAIGNVEFHQGSWTTPLPGVFDALVSNPPYVAAGDPHLAQGDCRFEPMAALSPGPDGLEAIVDIVVGAPSALRPGGWLVLEHGFDQGGRVRALLGATWTEVATECDLAGHERVSRARRS